MKLRRWQSECIEAAFNNFQNGKKNFLALATPGAGKTLMASILSKKLYDNGFIDLIFCFSPSSVVSSDFADSLNCHFNTHFDGSIGALGNSLTYQSLATLDNRTWELFNNYRVFVIFDEIHHCSGSCMDDANSWGAKIIDQIKEKSAYSISLTGTPWRSDAIPIVLSDYCIESGKIKCDYIYDLKSAIQDGVCRVPQIVAIDNDNITVKNKDSSVTYNSFLDILSKKLITYTDIVTNTLVIEQLLSKAIEKLECLRQQNNNSGGLIIASSIAHARNICAIMLAKFNIKATIVTSHEYKPNEIITHFRSNKSRWLISVGMVSEGTNIPRLQVCCNLTNIKTEMYFRQILGRILRNTNEPNQEAFMYVPADPQLIAYAQRIAQDVPENTSEVKIFDLVVENKSHIFLEPNQPGSEENLFSKISTYDIELSDSIINQSSDIEAFTQNKTPQPNEKNTIFIKGNFNYDILKLNGILITEISKGANEKLNQLNIINSQPQLK